ncbi:Zn-ribbon domain-containing OB-fold protein [Acidovorax soli]|uniref:Zn-ribbon domain-containing OB-fold protein n=1 Tax=Acidovorax soli TaxID=592050 RepID=UPI003D6D9EBE
MPRPNAQTQPYWEGAAAGELRYQRCAVCGHVQLIPRSLCEHCHGRRLDWQASERTGTVLTFTTVYRAPLPVFKDMVPYVIAIVDMDEGFRVMANAKAQGREGLEIGARVRIGFQEVHGMALPAVDAVLGAAA